MPQNPYASILTAALALLTAGLLLALPAGLAAQGEPADPPAQPPAHGPELTFDEQGLAVSGLTPGGEVAVFGVGRVPLEYLTRVVRHEAILTADATGVAILELPEGLPERSVWAAVDLTTGGLVTSSPPTFPAAAKPLPATALRRGRAEGLSRLGHSIQKAQVLWVRPGTGAWGTALEEGGTLDLDGADDGAFEIALEDLVPVAASPLERPGGVDAGDVLLVVDPDTLTLFTLRVTPDLLSQTSR